MWSKLCTSVVPFATIPAIINAAPARKSVAKTGEPDKLFTPSKKALFLEQ